MISSRFRPLFKPFLERVVTIFEMLGFTPNTLTLFGFLLSLIAFGSFFFISRTLGLALFLISLVFDAFDGALARKTKKVTKFGEYLDATSDKIVEAMVFFCFGVYSWPLAFLGGTTSILVSYFKHRADRLGININLGFFERLERMLFVLAGALLSEYLSNPSLMIPVLWISIILSCVTIIQRGLKARQLLT